MPAYLEAEIRCLSFPLNRNVLEDALVFTLRGKNS